MSLPRHPAPSSESTPTIATNAAGEPVVPARHAATQVTLTMDALGQQQSPSVSQDYPQEVAGYHIEAWLGEGGMGTVYRALDADGNAVALKLLRAVVAAEPGFAQRFAREAKIAASVVHENIVRFIDHGSDQGRPFMVFELLQGGDLDGLIARRGSLTQAKALTIVRDAARGLAAIHAAGLIHRDIKPANIFLDTGDRVRIGDLGLARHSDGEDRMTMTGMVIGTPAYMPPEQLRGETDLDGRADIYSLGASLYRMVTGQDPFVEETMYLVTSKVLNEPMPDPRALDPSVAPEIAAIIAKASAKEVRDRYASCEELIQDVEAALAAKPLLYAVVGPIAKATSSPKDKPNRNNREAGRSLAHAASPGQGVAAGSSGGLLNLPAGSGRLISISLLVVVFGVLLTALPSMGTSGSGVRPAWVSDMGHDEFGKWATVSVSGIMMRLRWIEPGQFTMGSHTDEAHRGAHETPHAVMISSGFWLLEHEVTQGAYKNMMGSVPSHYSGPDLPVDSVTWYEAKEFCRQLGNKLSGTKVRLPTEAEWEYACRAGSFTPFATVLPNPDSVGQFAPLAMREPWLAADAMPEDSASTRAKVDAAMRRLELNNDDRLGAQKPAGRDPNPWGLYDMHGNLSEWCQDHWDGSSNYHTSAASDPLSTKGDGRILRGGSWYDPPRFGRSAARDLADPDYSDSTIGFRFVIAGQ